MLGTGGRQAHGVWGTREPGGCPSPGAAEQPDPPHHQAAPMMPKSRLCTCTSPRAGTSLTCALGTHPSPALREPLRTRVGPHLSPPERQTQEDGTLHGAGM